MQHQYYRLRRKSLWNLFPSLCILLTTLFVFNGCTFDVGPNAQDITKQSLAVVNTAISTIDNNSQQWQQALKDAQAKLTQDAQSTIRNEISNTLNRGIAAVGIQLRCGVDFLGSRALEVLNNIKAKLLGQHVDPPKPVACEPVPNIIDMNVLDPNGRNLVTIDGYNFDTNPPVKAFLLEGTNASTITKVTDISSSLATASYYLLTLNLGANGTQITSGSQAVELKWNDKVLSIIQVIQRYIPMCQTRTDSYTPPEFDYTPPHIGKGDGYFGDQGPHVSVAISLVTSSGSLGAIVYADFAETGPDWSEASGVRAYTMPYVPPLGWKIVEVYPRGNNYEYTHVGNAITDYYYPGGGGVDHYAFTGFAGDQAAGLTATVKFVYTPLQVTLQQTSNCQ